MSANKIKFIRNVIGRKCVLAISFMFCSLIAFAQPGGPGQGDCGDTPEGPDAPCPLDTWVIILAFLAVVFAAIYLQRKQKTLKPAAKGF